MTTLTHEPARILAAQPHPATSDLAPAITTENDKREVQSAGEAPRATTVLAEAPPVAMAEPIAVPAADPASTATEGATPEPPPVTIEIGEILIRLSAPNIDNGALALPQRTAAQGETASLGDFLRRQSDGWR
nr:hypothetical protein [uncultured Sphingomonas sp.]